MKIEKTMLPVPERKKLNRPDRLQAGDYVKIINVFDGSIIYGRIVYETNHWREIQTGAEFIIKSYFAHRFFTDLSAVYDSTAERDKDAKRIINAYNEL